MRLKKTIALIMDEIQRCPAETDVAVTSKVRTAVAVGDRGQELYPFTQQDRGSEGLQAQAFRNQVRPSFAAELLLARSEAAPGALDTAVVHHLTPTERFGNPLAASQGRPTLCARLRASIALGKITIVDHIWHKAPRNTCYFNLGYFPGRAANAQCQNWARGK